MGPGVPPDLMTVGGSCGARLRGGRDRLPDEEERRGGPLGRQVGPQGLVQLGTGSIVEGQRYGAEPMRVRSGDGRRGCPGFCQGSQLGAWPRAAGLASRMGRGHRFIGVVGVLTVLVLRHRHGDLSGIELVGFGDGRADLLAQLGQQGRAVCGGDLHQGLPVALRVRCRGEQEPQRPVGIRDDRGPVAPGAGLLLQLRDSALHIQPGHGAGAVPCAFHQLTPLLGADQGGGGDGPIPLSAVPDCGDGGAVGIDHVQQDAQHGRRRDDHPCADGGSGPLARVTEPGLSKKLGCGHVQRLRQPPCPRRSRVRDRCAQGAGEVHALEIAHQ